VNMTIILTFLALSISAILGFFIGVAVSNNSDDDDDDGPRNVDDIIRKNRSS
jgi:hypothetical protein